MSLPLRPAVVAGEWVAISGQVGVANGVLVEGGISAETRQGLANLVAVLEANGLTPADVVKTNTFVTDFDEFQKCADVRMRYLGVATPTSTTVGVTRLAGPDFMVEIEAVAVVNG